MFALLPRLIGFADEPHLSEKQLVVLGLKNEISSVGSLIGMEPVECGGGDP